MQDPELKTAHRHWSGLTSGLVVIAVGVAFPLWNFDVRLPFMRYRNWCALFILNRCGRIALLRAAPLA